MNAPPFHRSSARVQAVVFDWAGTTLDYGSCAPARAFVNVFARQGVSLTAREARGPMGMNKRAHIEALLADPAISDRWSAARGGPPVPADVDRMYADFLPVQIDCLPDHAALIPGTVETVAACRQRGLKIGSSTGYVREMMDVLIPLARAQGYEPDCVVTASDISAGRPAPWLNLENARRLNVYPPATIVVVDDTRVGIEAGLHAGMWAVGVARSGNELGLSPAEVSALPPDELETRVERARSELRSAGSHFVIDSVADLVPVLDEIERRMQYEA